MTKRQKQEQKIAIAKDVIAQIKAQKFVASSGTYTNFSDDVPFGDLQKSLRKVKRCEVCALGSAFLSQIRLYDKFELNDHTSNQWGPGIKPSAIRRKLHEIFTPRELGALEASFEGDDGFIRGKRDRRAWRGYVEHVPNGNRQHCSTLFGYIDFLDHMNDEDTRLIWLMKVIVKHGTFSLKLAAAQAWEDYKAALNPGEYGFVA